MRALVITVAGMATRFSASVGTPCVKCVFSEGDDPSDTLLGRLLKQAGGFDYVVVVVGWGADDIRSWLDAYTPECVAGRVIVVDNPHYSDYGSGWSLYVGLLALKGFGVDSVLFAEGDLYLDKATFAECCDFEGDLVTVSNFPIEAKTSVALYFNADGHPRYVYDTSHGLLEVPEPFSSIHNSGQVWGFGDAGLLFRAAAELGEEAHHGTNLVLVNEYFSRVAPEGVRRLSFATWVNCNTITDWRRAFGTEG